MKTSTKLEDNLDETQRKVTQLHDEVARLLAEKASLTAESAAIQEDRERIRQKNSQLANELTQTAREKKAVDDELVKVVAEREQLCLETMQAQQKIAQLSDEHAAIAAAAPKLSDERDRLHEENKQLNHQVADLTSNMSALDETNLMLATERDRLRDEIDRLGERVTAEADVKSEATHENSCLATENAELSTALAEVRQALAESGSQLADSMRRIEDLEQELCALRATQPQSGQASSQSAGVRADGDSAYVHAASFDSHTSHVEAQPVGPCATSAFAPNAATPPSPSKSESFIDRYAHLLPEDCQNNEETRPSSLVPTDQNDSSQPPSVGHPFADQPRAEADEVTIEQYMAKLLQRVRGGAPDKPELTTLAPCNRQKVASHREVRSSNQYINVVTQQVPSGAAASSSAAADEERVTTSLGTTRRKSKTVEQPANLEALRALANESTRRAIGKHAQRIHRRDAVGKAIVSALAGMTGVWLMLEALSWRDLQFSTGCAVLLTAAYWARQTYCTLTEAFRAASYGRPPTTTPATTAPFHQPLPIDVEQSE